MDLSSRKATVFLIIQTDIYDAENIAEQLAAARRKGIHRLTDLHLDGKVVDAFVSFPPLTEEESRYATTNPPGTGLRPSGDRRTRLGRPGSQADGQTVGRAPAVLVPGHGRHLSDGGSGKDHPAGLPGPHPAHPTADQPAHPVREDGHTRTVTNQRPPARNTWRRAPMDQQEGSSG